MKVPERVEKLGEVAQLMSSLANVIVRDKLDVANVCVALATLVLSLRGQKPNLEPVPYAEIERRNMPLET